MIKLIIKFVIGILAIPVAIGTTQAFYNNILLISELASSLNLFIWGIVAYVVLHLLFYKPTFLYVLGHEAVHAGTSWIMGGKVKEFKVSKEGGAVTTDKTNVLVELSPYFVPIYAIVIAVIYFVVAASYNINGATFVFLIGFTLAFHIISTIEVMKIRQPDIVKSGYIFSIIFVYVLNIAVISFIFSLLFPAFKVKVFFTDAWISSGRMYIAIVKQLFF
ncbi:MAG: hypothetical protein NTZ95_00865 [Candidatus Omnitrophica bacterium]|nr:hypothetical protein [Candidatus Omnitrophota bacterium]